MTKTDKKIFWGFIFFAVFILLFGYFNLKERIEGPFRVAKSETQLTEQDVRQLLAQKDTDSDGLTDEEEIFKYGTSIYLVDSDGDGYNDKEEIEAGSDPLHPESTPLRKEVPSRQEIIIPDRENLAINEIREILIKMGIPKETIDQVDDQMLIKIYQETIEETGINPRDYSLKDLGQLNFSQKLSNQEEINLSADEIRQIMLEAGAEPEILAQIDDQTLKSLFSQALLEMGQ